MINESLEIEFFPELENPLLIAGFDGWGNALDISRGMVEYIIRKMDARPFARVNPDLFYRFDENRPMVEIEDGTLKSVSPPGAHFFTVDPGLAGRDIIILKATEPNLCWFQFADTLLSLCQRIGVKTIVSLGSMYDSVLHTDMTVSTLASREGLIDELKAKGVLTVSYKGPGAIHSTIHWEAKKRGFDCISLWCHCPYYLQGTTHFGLLSHLGCLLSEWGGFHLDTEELEVTWRELIRQIQEIIDKNPELQAMIADLRKAKVKGLWDATRKHEKIIHLEDFLKQR
jgi:proteasome assembly chaperone (PAC2) family protein